MDKKKKSPEKKMEKLKTVNIKGKQYVTVNERIRYFNEAYKNGCIKTELLKIEEKTVLMKAIVWPDSTDASRFFSGYAQETKGKSYINATSYIENCETSAVGRALGFMGIGVEVSIASAEEVSNAIERQNQKGSNPSEIKPPEEIPLEGNHNPSKTVTPSKNPNEGEVADDWEKGETVSNVSTDEQTEIPAPKSKLRKHIEFPQQKSKETSKEDILTVEEVCNKAPGQVTSKDLQKAFGVMEAGLGEQLFGETLKTFGKKSIADVKKAATGQMLLQVMIGKWHAERKAGDE